MAHPDNPNFGLHDLQREETVHTAYRLNELFRLGASGYEGEAAQLLQSIERPILVDLNGVLISDRNNEMGQKYPNPQALHYLNELKKVGTVVMCTVSPRPWEQQKERFEEWGLWDEDVVLMSPPNWQLPNVTRTRKQSFPPVTEYFEFMQQLGFDGDQIEERIVDLQFQSHKAIAPLFMKPYDIPIIDDASTNTINNPGMLGVLVTPFGADEVWTEAMRREGRTTLDEAIEKVKAHYTDPFEGQLVLTDFKEPGMTTIYQHVDDPEMIIRDEDAPASTQRRFDEMRKNMVNLSHLRNTYGIAMPNVSVVIRPDYKTGKLKTYIVTERVHGERFDHTIFTPEEAEDVAPKIDVLFTTILSYIRNASDGEWIRSDLAHVSRFETSNRQFIYGTRKGEEEKRIYLVDVGAVGSLGPHELRFMGNNFQALYAMVAQAEPALHGLRLQNSRQQILEAFLSLPDSDFHKQPMIDAIINPSASQYFGRKWKE